MRRLLWLFLIAGLWLVPHAASAQMAFCPGVGQNTLLPYAFESVTVGNTAVPLTASVYAPTGVSPKVAALSLEADNIRFRVDGVAPTGSVGHLVALPTGITSVAFLICGQAAIQQFEAIRTSTNATLRVTYYR